MLEWVVFGKEGCVKCDLLLKRLKAEVAVGGEKAAEVSVKVAKIGDVDGLTQFCQMEVLNINRIPSVLLLQNGKPVRAADDAVLGSFQVPQTLGIQTDYSTTGVITPAMVKRLVDLSLAAG